MTAHARSPEARSGTGLMMSPRAALNIGPAMKEMKSASRMTKTMNEGRNTRRREAARDMDVIWVSSIGEYDIIKYCEVTSGILSEPLECSRPKFSSNSYLFNMSDPFGADVQVRRMKLTRISRFQHHLAFFLSQFTSAPAAPIHDELTPAGTLNSPLDLSQFSNDDQAVELNTNPAYSAQLTDQAAPIEDLFSAPADSGMDSERAQPFIEMTPASESQAAFIGGYIPAVVEAPVPVSSVVVDPMAAWLAANSAALKKKDQDEAAAKKAAAEKAKAFLAKTDADRKKAVDARKASNRAAQKASPDSGVPEGKTWEKVFKLTDFSHDKARTKDLGRFKTVLTHCKDLDVKVAIKA